MIKVRLRIYQAVHSYTRELYSLCLSNRSPPQPRPPHVRRATTLSQFFTEDFRYGVNLKGYQVFSSLFRDSNLSSHGLYDDHELGPPTRP